MADQDTQDKQLPASGRKISRARSEGQVPRSRDLGHLATMAAGGAVVIAFAPAVSQQLQELLATALRFDARSVANEGVMLQRLSVLAWQMLLYVLAFGAVVTAAGIAASVLSGGWLWTLKPLAPDFTRMNPVSGLGNMVSKQRLIDTLKVSALALIVGAVGAAYLQRVWPELVAAQAVALPAAFGVVGSKLATALTWLLVTLALFALVDVPLQRHLWAERLKMSRQEMKDEMRETEGNPEVKNRIKNLMRERVRRRMLAAVPKADLVVMNPTHYAVALQYDEAKMGAPRVVAKGADLLALKIRDIAHANQVPVLQAAPLARALYAHTEVDQEVPLALYSAVAQVLAYVYQLRAALSGQAPYPQTPDELPVPDDLDPHKRPSGAGPRAPGAGSARH